MSATAPDPVCPPDTPLAAPSATAPRRGPPWLREPLLHFVLLGLLLFVADRVFVVRDDDPRTIVVGAQVDAEARQLFHASRNRDPNAEELAALRRTWLDNELLYREGLAMQVDKGDTAIRDRVVFKALSVIDAGLKPPVPDDAALRAWFDGHRAQYDEPARFDFQEAALAGESGEAAVKAFVAELNGGTPGDAKAGLRVFKGRPHANLVQSYGEDFARTLEALPPGEWRAVATREGWRAVRLDAATPARAAVFESVKPVVRQDWLDATMSKLRTDAVRRLERKYTVKTEGTAP